MNRTHRLQIALLFLLSGTRADAQVSAFLPPHHWSRLAVIRMHAAGGSARGLDPAARVHAAAPIAALLEDHPYAQRLLRERGTHSAGWFQVAATMTADRNVLNAGRFDADRVWQIPHVRRDVTAPGLQVHADATVRSRAALSVAIDARSDARDIEQAIAEVGFGRIGVWGGRAAQGYAPSAGGGLVLDGGVPIDGIGVRTLEPLGMTSFELALGRVDSSGIIARPRLLLMRAHARPHARFDLGLTRAAVFGAEAGAHTGARDILSVLLARNPQQRVLDDQVASADARWRPPLRAMTFELYGEWAIHDADPEVLWDMPAFAIGVRVPMLPGMRALGASIEHTQIARSCCNNPPWYHHFELADGWTENGLPRGHPLGGHGREWRMTVDGAWSTARVLLHVEAFTRRRGDQNLYAPNRAGRSRGAVLGADVQVGANASGDLRLDYESADDWNQVRARLALRWRP